MNSKSGVSAGRTDSAGTCAASLGEQALQKGFYVKRVDAAVAVDVAGAGVARHAAAEEQVEERLDWISLVPS